MTAGDIDLGEIKDSENKKSGNKKDAAVKDADLAKLIVVIKEILGDSVKDVKSSDRLTDSAVCLVAADGDMDLHLARMLKQQGHSDMQDSSRILEINSSHQLIIKLSEISQDLSKKNLLGDVAHLLLDQAKITEGEAIKDPVNFAKRLNETLVKVLI